MQARQTSLQDFKALLPMIKYRGKDAREEMKNRREAGSQKQQRALSSDKNILRHIIK